MSKKPYWMGSEVKEEINEKLKNQKFRESFYEARSKRIKKAIAETIKKVREDRNISQIELARKAYTTQAVISRIENPKINYLPSIEVLARLANVLNWRLEILFTPNSGRRTYGEEVKVELGQ